MSAARPTSVTALLGEAQRAISKARYDAAVELLQQAAMLAPEDAEVRQMLVQTERASRRHNAAVERHRAATSWASKIEALIEAGELEPARNQLREAGLELGKHDALTALESQLVEREEAARRSLALELAGKANALLEAGDPRGAMKVAEQSLRFASVPEAKRIRERARVELAKEAEQELVQQAITDAIDDVERLLGARELARAGQRLRRAIDQLGNQRRFEELGGEIDRAKADLQFRQRVEWAERRSKEAEGLIQEASRLSLKGAYGEAVEQLEAARKLDPSHPDLEARLETARAAHQRQLAQQERAEQLGRRITEIRSHLDALRFDEADAAIRQGILDYGEPERFAPLATRLKQLREVERSGRDLASAEVPKDQRSQTDLLRRQQMLAAAYSWKQTFLFPFRGFGRTAFWVLLAVLVTLDALAAIPGIGLAFQILSLLVLIAAAGLVPHVVRATVEGRNLLPAWDDLVDPAHSTQDLLRFWGLFAAASLPLAVWLATRPLHGVPSMDSGLVIWLGVAILAWFGTAFGVVATGAAEVFGYHYAPRLAHHVRSLRVAGPDALFAIDVIFLLGLLVVLLTVQPFAPWLFLPAARAVMVYGLLLAPHLIGVLIRRHRLELSRIYA